MLFGWFQKLWILSYFSLLVLTPLNCRRWCACMFNTAKRCFSRYIPLNCSFFSIGEFFLILRFVSSNKRIFTIILMPNCAIWILIALIHLDVIVNICFFVSTRRFSYLINSVNHNLLLFLCFHLNFLFGSRFLIWWIWNFWWSQQLP